MSNSTEENKQEEQEEFIPDPIEDESTEGDEEGDTLYSEQLLKDIISSYEAAFNRNNDKHEVKYNVTLTTHKVQTKAGKKDVAYLRVEKAIRSKVKEIEDPNIPKELKLPEWQHSLVHTEAYPFHSLQERLNPKARWKDFLFQSCIARLVAAGLEYAELLQRMKKTNMEELQKEQERPKTGIEVVQQMPAALSPAEQQYKEHIQKLRQSEGIK